MKDGDLAHSAPGARTREFQMFSFIVKALGAATLLGGIALASTSASAGVLMSRSECTGGFWHVMTYDVTDPDQWTLISDQPTAQVCGAPGLMLHLFGAALLQDLRIEHRHFEHEREVVRVR
jgi:hypothetical protein